MQRKMRRNKLFALGCAISILLVSGCSESPQTSNTPSGTTPGKIKVIAAENFYGEVAQAVGGDRVEVITILDNPDADPHDYEPSPDTSRLVSDAQVIIYNGAGYDGWMDKVLKTGSSANSKTVTAVAEDLMGKKEGDNEHVWYDPETLPKLAAKMADDLAKLDPKHNEDFQQRAKAYISSLNPLKEKVQKLKQASATEIVVSEPIFDYMAEALNLKITDPTFARAIDEGTDPAPSDMGALQDEIKGKKAKLFVYNVQNSSPTVDNILKLANANGVPVVKVTETEPKGKNYLQWMMDQLDQIDQALGSK